MGTTPTSRRERTAVLWLLVACALWGMSFAWNKEAQALLGERLVETTGDARTAMIAPAFFPALRFVTALILCLGFIPASRRGWSRQTVRAGLWGGSLLAAGMLLQHYGLAHTTESLSSFLTSLTVLFTPMFASAVLRHRIGGILWLSVGCATAGVALMTLYREEGRFDVGALLGLACAIVFSAHILVVDHFGKREEPWRFTAAQFATAGVIFVGFSLSRPGGISLLSVSAVQQAMNSGRLMMLFVLATLLATLVTFGIMVRYQPRTTPTRAALLYLTEPLFATAYAWLAAGRTISGMAMCGGAMILLGNALAEILGRRGDRRGNDGADQGRRQVPTSGL